MEAEWRARRGGLCLKAGVTNLNAGSCSPTARAAHERSLELMRDQAEDPVHFVFRTAPAGLERARRALAAQLACDPRRLALLTNTSFAINMILKAFPWRAGDEVVTSDQEYQHYDALWRVLARERGLVVRRVALPLGDTAPEAGPDAVERGFAAAMGPRTRALFFSHVTSATGTVLPAAALCALARARGAVSIVDGAHAPGLVDVALGGEGAIGCDYYVANIHKWLTGATGSAFVYAAPERRGELAPLVTMAVSEYDPALADAPAAPGDDMPTRWCLSHEYQGTRNLVPLLVIPDALAFRASLPEDALRARTRSLAQTCRDALARLGYRPVSPPSPDLATCMQSFRMPAGTPAFDSVAAWAALRREHAIEVALPALAGGEPVLRVSCAWFNDEADLERLAAVLGGGWQWSDFPQRSKTTRA